MHAASVIQRRFRDRVRAPRAWSFVALVMPRLLLALVLAGVPAAALLLLAFIGPTGMAVAFTTPANVHDTFGRFIAAIATASAIAVSVASLTLRRELRGLGEQGERERANEEYRERVRKASGQETLPLSLARFLAASLDAFRDTARRVRRSANERALATRAGSLTLGEFLDLVESAAQRTRHRLVTAGDKPHEIAAAALDFEEEMTAQLTRRFSRTDGLGEDVDAGLADLRERLRDVVVGSKYAKTLSLQWGFSRMSTAITLTSLPAIGLAAGMVLLYGEGAVDALGLGGASTLVALAFAVILLPLTCFASYMLRFVFLNEHTLPTEMFVLGPEEPEVVAREGTGARRGRRLTG